MHMIKEPMSSPDKSAVVAMPQKRMSENKDEQVHLRLHPAQVRALESLTPGLGSTVPEVIRYIVIRYLDTKYDTNWMREKKLFK